MAAHKYLMSFLICKCQSFFFFRPKVLKCCFIYWNYVFCLIASLQKHSWQEWLTQGVLGFQWISVKGCICQSSQRWVMVFTLGRLVVIAGWGKAFVTSILEARIRSYNSVAYLEKSINANE